MYQSLHDHIIFLEQQIQVLSDLLTTQQLPTGERDRLAEQLQLATTAVEHYRKAFELEGRLKSDG